MDCIGLKARDNVSRYADRYKFRYRFNNERGEDPVSVLPLVLKFDNLPICGEF